MLCLIKHFLSVYAQIKARITNDFTTKVVITKVQAQWKRPIFFCKYYPLFFLFLSFCEIIFSNLKFSVSLGGTKRHESELGRVILIFKKETLERDPESASCASMAAPHLRERVLFSRSAPIQKRKKKW